jgi:hypothetical protein
MGGRLLSAGDLLLSCFFSATLSQGLVSARAIAASASGAMMR